MCTEGMSPIPTRNGGFLDTDAWDACDLFGTTSTNPPTSESEIWDSDGEERRDWYAMTEQDEDCRCVIAFASANQTGRTAAAHMSPSTWRCSPLSPQALDFSDEALNDAESLLSPSERYFNPGRFFPTPGSFQENYTFFSSEAENQQELISEPLREHKIQASIPLPQRPQPSLSPDQVWSLSKQKEGSRKVQKTLECAGEYEQLQIINSFQGRSRKAAMDPHANYALQKCIEVAQPEDLRFMVDDLVGHDESAVCKLAQHRYANRIVPKLIEHCKPEHLDPLVENLLKCAGDLAVHRFGNYAIQALLAHDRYKKRVMMRLWEHVDAIGKGSHYGKFVADLLRELHQ